MFLAFNCQRQIGEISIRSNTADPVASPPRRVHRTSGANLIANQKTCIVYAFHFASIERRLTSHGGPTVKAFPRAR